MQLHEKKQELLLKKILRRKDETRGFTISNVTPITDIMYREMLGYEPYEQAMKATDWKPIGVGEFWGGGKNGWFKLNFTIPESMKGKQVAAYLVLCQEGCVYINGKPYQGVDKNHDEVVLTKNAKPGEKFELIIDAHSTYWWAPEKGKNIPIKVDRADIASRNMEVIEYLYNLETLHLLACELPADTTRQARIIYTLNEAVDSFDYDNTDEASLKESAIRANKILQPLLDCKADASATNVAAIGHSHIDVAWLWPYLETKRKCARTFSTVMRLMEQYPEYQFCQSQAQLYEFVKETYPAIYEDIKQKIKEGRWEVTGSMWVEADCNLSSGESLIRQILVGKNYYKDEFGVDTDVLWLPDVFGYSAALPQILQKSGVPYFSTIKIGWSQFNKFPYSTFHWKGIDGSSVLAHFPPTGDYNLYPEPKRMALQVKNFKEKDRSDWSLASYGWGDGGGGPDRRHLEFIRRERDLEGLPRVHQMKVGEFFHKIDGTPDLPEWAGELYLEMHRGTYTTQAKNKKYNREAEFLYRDAELLGSIAAPMGFDYPQEELLKEWKRILCNQFHDVIPGSSIRQVYEETDQMYPEILEVGRDTAWSALGVIAKNIDTSGDGWPVIVFNTLSWDRKDLAEPGVPGKGSYAIVDPDGNEVPYQLDGESMWFTANVPAAGYKVYRIVEREPKSFKSDLKVSEKSLENKFFKITLDDKGLIDSIIEKSTGREVLPEGEKGNLLQLFEDKPSDWPAWDIDFFYEDKWQDITDLSSIEVADEGPVSASVNMTRKFGKSQIKQKMVIYSDIPRIDFQTWVDWHEKEKVLKASFPVDVNTDKARYEIQFGNVERPTHTNTSWDFARFEVCAHKWADISEEGFGMSLMNDCKYGHHTKGNVMRLSLLRSPKHPDEEADMGEHVFTYSIMPHAGDYVQSETVRRAYELNVQMPTMVLGNKPQKGSLPQEKSFISIDADNVILDTVKKAEKEDATILRFYECHNKRAEVTVTLEMPFKKVFECDLMEKNISEVKSDNGKFTFKMKPFEIKTFKLA